MPDKQEKQILILPSLWSTQINIKLSFCTIQSKSNWYGVDIRSYNCRQIFRPFKNSRGYLLCWTNVGWHMNSSGLVNVHFLRTPHGSQLLVWPELWSTLRDPCAERLPFSFDENATRLNPLTIPHVKTVKHTNCAYCILCIWLKIVQHTVKFTLTGQLKMRIYLLSK